MKAQGFELLGQRLRQDLQRHQNSDKVSDARTRRQLLLRHDAKVKPDARWRYGVAAGVLVAAAFALFSWTSSQASGAPLRFWIEERDGTVDEWVTARDAEQSLRFSDGSSVVAGPHTTTRVMQVTPDGARLTLERGRLDANVVHREASRWQVTAGPFLVRVTGTRFRVVWEPQTETLSVNVTQGRVEVAGGGHPQHELTAGSSLELSVAGAVELKGALGSAESGSPAPSAESSTERPQPSNARDEDELLLPRKSTDHKPDWRELSTAGHYREALAVVEQQGFVGQCESLGARDLLTLGSTARLSGRGDRAREAYLATRRRFPTSTEAGISAFSLGRLASDSGNASDAIGWFKRYLAEQPAGQLAREASGRLIEVLRQAGNEAQARTAAGGYLKRYPTGPHAALARSVLARP